LKTRYPPQNTPQGIAPTLILVRVALGLSNMLPSGQFRSGVALSQPTLSTQVRFGCSTVASMDAGWHLSAEMPTSEIKSKPSGGDLDSSLSSVENAATV
jgi:hypothetical protein